MEMNGHERKRHERNQKEMNWKGKLYMNGNEGKSLQ